MVRIISDETKSLMERWHGEELPVREIARRANVSYTTAWGYTRLRQNINPETGKPFESLSQYRKYLSKLKQQQPINQVSSEQPTTQEQKGLEASLIATLWGLEGIRPPTKIGYNDFAALFALAQNYKFSGKVFHTDISQALNASIFTPEGARLPPKSFDIYFERLKQLGLIQGASETGYTMDKGLVTIIFDNFNRLVTPSIGKDRFWNSISLY